MMADEQQYRQGPADQDRLVTPDVVPTSDPIPNIDPACGRAAAEFVGQGQGRKSGDFYWGCTPARRTDGSHVLHGPPGLGKTTMAQIISGELDVGFRATSGPVIARAGDLAALLTNLQPRDVLFIDEIHREPSC